MILLILAIVLALIVLSILFYVLLVRIFASTSGLGKLGRVYGGDRQPDGPTWSRQTIMIGSVQWKRCVTIGMGQSGLYLRVDAILVRLPALLIPWSAVRPQAKGLLYWRPAMVLSVGQPDLTIITVHMPLFSAMQPWLQPPSDDA